MHSAFQQTKETCHVETKVLSQSHRCKCHLNDGSGTVVTNGDFCNSWLEERILSIPQWVLPLFIQ